MQKKLATVLTVALLLVAVAVLAGSLVVSSVRAQSGTPVSTASPSAAPGPTVSKQCYSVPCHGNLAREAIYERIGDGKRDLIRAWGNFDRIHANTYSTTRTEHMGSQAMTSST
jgi:hypothetical protein